MGIHDEVMIALRAGGLCIVVDDPNREHEGDFVALGQWITAASLTAMVVRGRGLVCVPIGEARAAAFGLAPMVAHNGDPHGTAFTVSVDGVDTGTGISVTDRLRTIRTLATDHPDPGALRSPGHIFPLTGRPGGLSTRRGHTEAALALAELAGARDCGVICEILADDGTMLRGEGLQALATELGIQMVSLDHILAWQEGSHPPATDHTPDAVPFLEDQSARLPLASAHWTMSTFPDPPDSAVLHLGWQSSGASPEAPPPLVRIHSECLTGDVFGSLRCDCGPQLAAAQAAMEEEGRGFIFYLRQEGRGIGLHGKIAAYRLQDQGMDTVDANHALGYPSDSRDYRAVGRWLRLHGLTRVRLLTNNPAKCAALEAEGVKVEHRTLWVGVGPHNKDYLATKVERCGHLAGVEEVHASG